MAHDARPRVVGEDALEARRLLRRAVGDYDLAGVQRVADAAEKAKRELSTVQQTEINLPYITADATGPRHLAITLTRSKMEQLVMDLIEKSIGPVRQAMTDAGIAADQLGEVVLVGGQTRMPLVYEKVKQFFNKEPHKGVPLNLVNILLFTFRVCIGTYKFSFKDHFNIFV